MSYQISFPIVWSSDWKENQDPEFEFETTCESHECSGWQSMESLVYSYSIIDFSLYFHIKYYTLEFIIFQIWTLSIVLHFLIPKADYTCRSYTSYKFSFLFLFIVPIPTFLFGHSTTICPSYFGQEVPLKHFIYRFFLLTL